MARFGWVKRKDPQSASLSKSAEHLADGNSQRLHAAQLFSLATHRHGAGYGAGLLGAAVGVRRGVSFGKAADCAAGLAGWLLMARAYWPTLKLYGGSAWLALALPLIALLYSLMTLDSAYRHWIGQGGAWKGRTYSDGNL